MNYSIRTVGPIDDAEAIATVIDLAEAKAHLNVDFDDDDDLIEAFVAQAQDFIERYASRVLTPRAMEMVLSAFPFGSGVPFEIPRDPVTAISSIAYTSASDGSEVSLDAGAWRWSESQPGLILPAFGTLWPTAAAEPGSVRIQFEAGYEEGLAPASLVGAVKLMLTQFYDNRGAGGSDVPPGVVALCGPYRRRSI